MPLAPVRRLGETDQYDIAHASAVELIEEIEQLELIDEICVEPEQNTLAWRPIRDDARAADEPVPDLVLLTPAPEAGKRVRANRVELFARYVAGDRTLVKEFLPRDDVVAARHDAARCKRGHDRVPADDMEHS